MCGIAGFYTRKPQGDNVLKAMVEALVHRGPDEDGYFHDRDFHAGMRRLSINGLTHGSQPLFNTSKSIALLYNGEIYNYPSLKTELEKSGVRLGSDSDGEVLCHLYEKHGVDAFNMLDGMFAAALWDKNNEELYLVRDIPGEKPLYYSQLPDGSLAFSSELKSLKLHPDISRELDFQSLWDFPTFLWIPEPETVYKNIKAIPRAHYLKISKNGLELKKYYNCPELSPLNDEEAVIETRRVVTEAVRSRLLSDVPVGSFLSSGLDSSIVATIAAKELPHLTTFSIGFEDIDDPYHGKADESVYATRYAKNLGTTHHTIKVTQKDFRQELEVLAKYGDQPFSVSSGMGISAIARRAREEGIKVLLSGDCADELFGGYSWYVHLPLVEALGSTEYPAKISFQNTGLGSEEIIRELRKYSQAQVAWAMHYYASEAEKRSLFSGDIKEASSSSCRFFTGKHWSALDYLEHDRNFYLPFEMLRKVDRMTMAHSVEGRVPFAATSVYEHVQRLNFGQLLRNGELKWVLREAFRDILPKEVSTRPKHGFNVPIDHWLKEEWQDLLGESFSNSSALSRHGLISKNAWAQAKEMLEQKDRLNGHTLFSFIMLNRWLEEHA